MILAALVTRPVRRKPARFVATLLGIAAGVAAVVSTLSASGAALASLRGGVGRLSGAAALEVTCPGGVDETELARLAPLAVDAHLVPLIDRVVHSQSLGDSVRVLGVDLLSDPRFSGARGSITGLADVEAVLDGPAALLSRDLAQALRIGSGGEIVLALAAKPTTVRIVGTFDAGDDLGRLVVLDIAWAQRLLGENGRLSRIEILPRPGAARTDLRERAAALVSPGLTLGTPADRVAATNALVRSLEFNLGTLSGISLLVGGVLVATTLATSVLERRRGIALLYSIGASRAQIVRALLVEALILGGVGSALGAAAGLFAARFLVDGLRSTLSTVVSTTAPTSIPFDVSYIAVGFGLGVIVSLAAAIVPVREGATTPPIQSLRGETPALLAPRARRVRLALALLAFVLGAELVQLEAWHGLPIAALAGTLCFLLALLAVFGPCVDAIGRLAALSPRTPVMLRLACAGLSAGRRRAAWASGAVGVAVALAIAIATMVGSFRSTVVTWVERSITADLAVRPRPGPTGVPIGKVDRAVLELVRATRAVVDVYGYYTSAATVGDQDIGFAGIPFEAVAKRGWCALVDGSDSRAALASARRNGSVLVSEAAAYRLGWKPGDVVTFTVRGRRLEKRVEAVFADHSDSRGSIVVDEPLYLELSPEANPNFVDLNCATPADVETVRAHLHAELAGRYDVEINDNPTMRASILSVFDRTFAITSALQGVSALVAVLAVASVLFALVSERRADVALLAAVGASRGQVFGLVAAQAGLLGLLGASLGSLCGLLIGFVLTTVVNVQSFGWTLTFERPWSTMSGLVLLVACACAVVGLWPARAAVARSLSSALREESA